jgi:hypothetical protein
VHDHGQPARQCDDCFFTPRRLAICIAQALSQDQCVERISRIWAASKSMTRIISSPHFDIAPVRSLSPD